MRRSLWLLFVCQFLKCDVLWTMCVLYDSSRPIDFIWCGPSECLWSINKRHILPSSALFSLLRMLCHTATYRCGQLRHHRWQLWRQVAGHWFHATKPAYFFFFFCWSYQIFLMIWCALNKIAFGWISSARMEFQAPFLRARKSNVLAQLINALRMEFNTNNLMCELARRVRRKSREWRNCSNEILRPKWNGVRCVWRELFVTDASNNGHPKMK